MSVVKVYSQRSSLSPPTSWDSHNRMRHLVTQVRLGSLLHFRQDHGGDFFRGEILQVSLRVDLDHGLSTLVDELEGEMLDITLHIAVVECSTEQSLGVKDRVGRILRCLVLCGVTHESFLVGEPDPRRSDSVTLVVGDDFNLASTLDPARQRPLETVTYATQEYVVPRSIPITVP